MALTNAPWLNVGPSSVIDAMSSGARLGLERNRLGLEQSAQMNAASEAGDRLRLAYAQLASQNAAHNAAESARAEDDNRQNAALILRQAQEGSLNKYRNDSIGIDQQKLADLQAKEKSKQDKQDETESHTTNFVKELANGSDATDALKKNPLAGNDPMIRGLVVQDAIAKRVSATQDAITGRSGNRLEQKNTQFRVTDLSRQISRIEGGLNNPNLSLDDATKKQMQQELQELKAEKAGLEKGLTLPSAADALTAPAVGTLPTSGVQDDPLGITSATGQ